MPFDHKLIEDALNSNVDPKEVEAFAAESDPLVKDALAAGVPLTEVINHYKTQGGEQTNEDQITTRTEGGSQDRGTQDGAASQVQASTPVGVQADGMPPAQDKGQLRGDDQARVTTQPNEEQTQDAQGGIQGTQEGEGISSQVPSGNQAEVAPQQAAMKAAPFVAESVPSAPAEQKGIIDYTGEALKAAYKGLGTFASEAQQYAFDLAKLPLTANAATAEAIFGPNPFSEKIKKGIIEKGDQYFADLVAGSKMTEEEAKSPLNQFSFGIGHMIGDLIPAVATAGLSAEEQAISKAANLPIWKTIGQKAINGMKDFSVPALISANSKIDEEKEAGKTDAEALASGMKSLIETEAGAAIPMQVASGLDNIILRGASRILQSTPLAVAQSELAKVAGNVMSKESERTPTITENIIAGNFDQAAMDLAQVAPMGLLGVMGERAKPIKDAGLPATAAVIESEPIKPRLEIEAVADIKTPTELPKPAEAPAEAQPIKPSESQAPAAEAEKLPTIERKPVEPQAAVKAEEGVAQREGEGKVKITKNDAGEIQYKLSILSDEPDLLYDYGLNKKEVDDLIASIPANGGNWSFPTKLKNAIISEIEDHIVVLKDQYNDLDGSASMMDEYKGLSKGASKRNITKTIKSLKSIVGDIKSFEPESAKPEVSGKRIAAASYTAPNGVVYEGASHPEAMEKAKEAGSITQEEVDAKQDAASRNTPEFGFTITDEDGNRTQAPRNEATKIARASGQAIEESLTPENTFKNEQGEELIHSNQTKLDDFPKAEEAKPEQTFIQKAESWADSVIKESAKRVSTGLDPEVLAAYAVKGSIVIGRGVRNFGVWSGEMVKQFGEEIRPYLKDIWSKSKAYAEDEAKIQMETRDYIQRREEALSGGGKTVMRGVSERIAREAKKELRQSDEFKTWEIERDRLSKEWMETPKKSEERKIAREKYREHLRNKPESEKAYYIQADELVRRKTLSDVEVNEWIESLTPEQAKAEYEKSVFAPASDEKTAAVKVKLAARRLTDLEAAGDDAGYAQVANEVSREITVAAQVLRDARFLYKATPKGFTALLEKIAEKKNIKIKPQKIAEIELKFKEFTEAGKKSERVELEVVNAQSEEEFNSRLKSLKKSREEGFKKQNELDKSVGGIWPKSGREELIPTLIRGNYLTTMSTATNLSQNILRGTFLDVKQKLIRSQYSKAESLLTGEPPKYVFGLEQAALYYATLAKESPELVRNLFRTALRQPLPADKPVNITEIRASLNPMAALRRLKGIYNKESLQYEGDYKFKDAIKDLLEGTSGIPADVMFDLLTATDRPFRQAVMISEASGMARKLGLKGLDYEKFIALPQRGIEKWARANIIDPAKRAEEIKSLKQELEDAVSEGLGEAEVTIGGKNVTRGAGKFLKNIAKSNPIASVLVYANAPYVRFPLNFAVTAFKLSNPELAMTSFLMNAARGNSKKAAIDFSIFVSGLVFAYAGAYLYNNGVIQTTDSPQTKAQRLSGELGRSGSMNTSKLKRIIKGESSDTMFNDDIVRLDRLGLIGIAMLSEADKQAALKKKQLLTGDLSFADSMITRLSQIPVSLAYTLNQTFAKGLAGVVDALTEGEGKMEKLLKNTFTGALSIAFPNEMSAISRSISKYTPNLDDPKFMKTLENATRQRFGMTGDLPVKRGFWGEKIESTPEGANPIAYHFYDFTKKRKLPSVPATMEIIRLFEKTQDDRVIPSEVQNKITIKGTTYRLPAKDHERYQELVGAERLKQVNNVIDSTSYQSSSVDRKADKFSKAIDRGARIGERKFLEELKTSGVESGEVIKIPRKELVRRISELESEAKSSKTK